MADALSSGGSAPKGRGGSTPLFGTRVLDRSKIWLKACVERLEFNLRSKSGSKTRSVARFLSVAKGSYSSLRHRFLSLENVLILVYIVFING